MRILGSVSIKVSKEFPDRIMLTLFVGDLNASEISMPDEERIELMIRVKEGKISMHDAIERVRLVRLL